jgi:antibiotic biosynthesis monooxygenase (ABM) superfamily enzyme
MIAKANVRCIVISRFDNVSQSEAVPHSHEKQHLIGEKQK